MPRTTTTNNSTKLIIIITIQLKTNKANEWKKKKNTQTQKIHSYAQKKDYLNDFD